MSEYATSPDGTRIAFERAGRGPVVVLVDGAAMHRAFGTSRELVRLLAHDVTAVAYDRRGRGESSDTAPWTPEREVEDLQAVIAAATGSREDEPVVVHTLSSGAVLALLAVAHGAPIRALSLFEPPIELDGDITADSAQIDKLTALVAADRRREAVQEFQAGIGMPAEMIAQQPPEVLAALDLIAPTLVYDLTLSRTGMIDPETLAGVTVPVQVISSDTGSGPLGGWAAALADALPHGRHRTLPGSWHGVPEDVLAPVIAEWANTAVSSPRVVGP